MTETVIPIVGSLYMSTNTVGDFLPYVDPTNRLVRVSGISSSGNMVTVETHDGKPLGRQSTECLQRIN